MTSYFITGFSQRRLADEHFQSKLASALIIKWGKYDLTKITEHNQNALHALLYQQEVRVPCLIMLDLWLNYRSHLATMFFQANVAGQTTFHVMAYRPQLETCSFMMAMLAKLDAPCIVEAKDSLGQTFRETFQRVHGKNIDEWLAGSKYFAQIQKLLDENRLNLLHQIAVVAPEFRSLLKWDSFAENEIEYPALLLKQ